MTAKEYYNSQSLTDANRLIVDKNKVNYSRSDLIRFAESYASQQTEKYKELIEWLNDECPTVSPPLEPYTTADLSHDFAEILRSRLNDLKNELGL